MTASTCRILELDPDLAQGLSEEDRVAATRAFVAPALEVSGPRWHPPDYDGRTIYGLLILDGLLGCRMKVGAAVATELLGAGDILRPWSEPPFWKGEVSTCPIEWRVFRPTRLALLDERITALIGRRPELIVNFSSRLLRRVRSTAYLMAISHQTRVENRLMETLWHLASTWGRVTPQGVRIPFRITHEVLSEILGAQRPSVTTAFRRLSDQGLVVRAPDGTFILTPRVANSDQGPELASADVRTQTRREAAQSSAGN